ncbi:xanthine dehydrogenase family protein molybdopterin-binding subunit [Ferrovibrio sp.]|uniref:xanthine dehydrogenase family protein molybdopterin-binding subunit n=1 Tax=Ferrovibrio sp. TaxID=1917215 RepID=UPI0025C674DC|nr:xanthine dehydrogenase family protein molybdopterin-binding subunit [Ferrovibrio sp.]MBX3453610.1 xanthine dehydrogenase family protein molybdopterin-binding subunit [Ferrovibrio sp.]
MSANYRIVGKSHPRFDAVGKVTGKAIYGTDFALPGMLHGKLCRSSQANARIKALHVDAARRMPGVRAIVTAADVPCERYGSFIKDMEVFAAERVRYIGQPIAGVVARSAAEAEAAAAAIVVEYEALPAVFDPEAALAPDAPRVHEDLLQYKAMPTVRREGNISNRARLIYGDVEAGFARSDRIFTHRYSTCMVHPGYTEPRAAVATWDSDGRYTVWSNTQLPFEAQNTLADILMVPASQVRVICTVIGGGFGGKLRLGVEHYVAVMAKACGRPVKMVTSTEEEMTTAYPRQPVIVELKTGVSADGRILAKQGRIIVDTGATSGSGVGVGSSSALILAGPYRIPNLLIEGLAVYTNKTPTGSFRAPSGPQANFAVEAQMDAIAEAIGLDPLEFRLRNILRDGDVAPNGQQLGKVSLEECLRKAADAIGWADRKPGPWRGKGIACSWWTTTSGSSGVYVKVDPDGKVVMNTGCAEIGTGALTGAAMVLAEDLGVAVDDISIVSADSTATPFDYGAQGSRTAFAVGNACRAAVVILRQQALAAAAKRLDVAEDKLTLADGKVSGEGKSLSLADIARGLQLSGGGLIAHGTFIAPPTMYDAKRSENMVITTLNSPSFHAHAAEVSVDPQTGEVRIEDYVVAQDVGFAINPIYVEGQIEGGVMQGLGQALSEEIVYRDGRVLNANLTDYKMPTAVDAPRIRSILVECPSESGPFGAKGVGEPPVIEPPATIANAVAAACGCRIADLPITAEKVATALQASPRA